MNMKTEAPEENQEEISPNRSEWNNRVLCSDGNCIGVIGSDGGCKECGKKYEGALPETIVADTESRSEGEDELRADADMDAQPSVDTVLQEETEADDWVSRQLCSDGNCIGVIGPDGRCKECGKPLE